MNGNYNRLLTDTPLSCKGWAMFDIATQQLLPRVQRVPYRKLGNSIWSEKSLLPHMTHKIQIVELLSELQRISQIINHLSVIFFSFQNYQKSLFSQQPREKLLNRCTQNPRIYSFDSKANMTMLLTTWLQSQSTKSSQKQMNAMNASTVV